MTKRRDCYACKRDVRIQKFNIIAKHYAPDRDEAGRRSICPASGTSYRPTIDDVKRGLKMKGVS